MNSIFMRLLKYMYALNLFFVMKVTLISKYFHFGEIDITCLGISDLRLDDQVVCV